MIFLSKLNPSRPDEKATMRVVFKVEILDLVQTPCMNSCMATETISLELDAYERLRRAKREGESFSGVVRRARFGPADARGSSILAALGDLPAHASDEEAVRFWEESGEIERTASHFERIEGLAVEAYRD